LSSPVTTPTEAVTVSAADGQSETWLTLVKEALFGSKKDFTAISIDRAIFLLAVPMVLEMAMESLFGIVDIFWVAHLGADSTATVGITEGMLTMIFAVAIGMSMGTTAVVARRTGEQDPSGAAEAAVQSIILGIIVSAVIFAVCFPFAPRLLALMGASPSIVHIGVYADHDERLGNHPDAVLDQRHLSWRGRCCCRHACVVAGQCHQPHS
jgi:hypothetical protein